MFFPLSDGYKKLTKRRDDIIEYLASQKTAKKLASKLLAAEFITHSVYNQANNYATNVVETDRVTVMFDAVLAAVKLNPSKFNKFLSILKEIEGLGDIVAFIDGKLLLILDFEDSQLKVYQSCCSLIYTIPVRFSSIVLQISHHTYIWQGVHT